jgi:Na+-translocating ferredoxin:NAD+ oxidoreductase subunit B
MLEVGIAVLVLFGLTLVFATLLSVAKDKLYVYEDPRIAEVNEALPAANCGACGYAGCADFAKAVVRQQARCDGCPVGGAAVANRVAEILGVEVVQTFPYRPVIHCAARPEDKLGRTAYEGVQSCAEANAIGTTIACTYGCLEFGDCAQACDFDALHMIDGKPVVDYVKCTGCGACVTACPRNLIEQIPFKQEQMLVIACANKEPAKAVKSVCKVGCIGCKLCQRMYSDVFQVKDNLAFIDYTKTAGDEDVAEVVKKCPADVMVYFGQPKAEYAAQLAEDEAAGDAQVAGGVMAQKKIAQGVAAADGEAMTKAFGEDAEKPREPIQ